jgi:hypothetical protein
MRSDAVRRQIISKKMGDWMFLRVRRIHMPLDEDFAEPLRGYHFEVQRRKPFAAEPRGFPRFALLRLPGGTAQKFREVQRGMVCAALHLKRKRNPVSLAHDNFQGLRVEHSRQSHVAKQLFHNDDGAFFFATTHGSAVCGKINLLDYRRGRLWKHFAPRPNSITAKALISSQSANEGLP